MVESAKHKRLIIVVQEQIQKPFQLQCPALHIKGAGQVLNPCIAVLLA